MLVDSSSRVLYVIIRSYIFKSRLMRRLSRGESVLAGRSACIHYDIARWNFFFLFPFFSRAILRSYTSHDVEMKWCEFNEIVFCSVENRDFLLFTLLTRLAHRAGTRVLYVYRWVGKKYAYYSNITMTRARRTKPKRPWLSVAFQAWTAIR